MNQQHELDRLKQVYRITGELLAIEEEIKNHTRRVGELGTQIHERELMLEALGIDPLQLTEHMASFRS